ncbi:DUF4153 domain-containing protein [Actinoplanes teichomyceticus]|uniref:Uncharacterized protein DUF4173 n=1 Tax=Actinoplanes teichomyceticus TaxID=1867 RepID=A0A561WR58_ACTTI|nr:DUF4173 domain-containing protein [Actinoplanes teichomyceticus]TWG26357.1 uncharacterized protein DUF4173 [Actinoplanes teichomyceticus]GIF11434.1 hypothetical protein Ate01nite_14660 [Actinoplanes teichomyceticus]
MSTAPPAAPQEQNITKGQTRGPGARRWGGRLPGPPRPATPGTVAAVAAATLVAALSLPLDEPGVGWLITAGAAALAVLVARPVASAGPPPTPVARARWDRLAWGTATVALAGVGTLRAAGWLFALCLLTATLTGALAIGAARSMRAVVVTYLMAPAAVLRAAPWLVLGLTRMRRAGRGPAPARMIATTMVSVALLAVFGMLFVSADAAFAKLFAAVLPDLRVDSVVRWVFICCLAAPALGGAAYLRAAPPDLSDLDRTQGRAVGRWEWAVPLGLLAALFAAFVAVQLAVLFGGERHVLTTAGLTYAEYARGGFWQLCAVIGLTLVVLAGAARWAPRQTTGDRAVFRAVLGSLTLLALVIVASALVRMQVYIDTYGLTRLRLLVACCEVWFGVVLILVLLAGIRTRAPWLPRAAIAAGVLALLGLAVANPDALIARDQVHRPAGRIDVAYLSGLSADAVPEIAELADAQDRTCVLYRLGLRLGEGEWRSWNLGRSAARDVIGDDPHPINPGECSTSRYGY